MSDEQLIKTPGLFGENGNFLLERELGHGGMGGVYMGRDKMLDRPVAVKVMLSQYGSDPEFVEKFKKEAQAAARLIHPNIAQIYSYGFSNGMPYIAMELVAGGSLDSLMKNSPGKTDIPRVVKICEQTAQALRCAADQGLVHGDIKPENILLDSMGNAKLVDFGLAAMQKDTNEIWGTPYYIAPEKLKKEVVDYRADIYNLGGTLYHALTGVPPFEGDDALAVVKARFQGPPKLPSDIRPEISPMLDDLVMTMLALRKEDRFPSFEALIEEFKNVMTTGLSNNTQTVRTSRMTVRSPRPTAADNAAAANKEAEGEDEPQQAPSSSKRIVTRKLVRRTTGTGATAEGASSKLKMAKSADKTAEGANTDAENTGAENTDAESEEEESGGKLGIKVLCVVGGVIALIGAIVGGLFWYKAHDKATREEDQRTAYAQTVDKARAALENNRNAALKFASEIDGLTSRAMSECKKWMHELGRVYPNLANNMQPEPSQELCDAIALTNYNAVAAFKASIRASTVNNSTPTAVKDMHELWERAYASLAAGTRIRYKTNQLVTLCNSADQCLQMPLPKQAETLGELSQTTKDQFENIKAHKDVETIRKAVGYIRSRAEKSVMQATNERKKEQAEAERKARRDRDLAEQEARRKAAMEAKQAQVSKEIKAANDRFEIICTRGTFNNLGWNDAVRELDKERADCQTPEGGFAYEDQLRKVNAMKSVHDLFIKNMKGYQFKHSKLGKLGAKVKSVDKDYINFEKGKGKDLPSRLTWQKFYKEYHGNLNELLWYFIENGRANCDPKLNLKQWAEAMSGAALTLRIVCSDNETAAKRAEELAKMVSIQYPDYILYLQKMFPDLTFETVEE